MKRIVFYAFAIAMITSFLSATAQNKWNVSAGVNLTPDIQKKFEGSTHDVGAGAFIGVGYEINFTPHWSFNPQIEANYINNYHKKEYDGSNHYRGNEYCNINIPLITSFRFNVSDKVGLRFGVGPNFQESVCVRHYKNAFSNEKEKMTGNFFNRFNVGIQGEAAVETGNHLSYIFRTCYTLIPEHLMGKTLTLSLGVRYSF